MQLSHSVTNFLKDNLGHNHTVLDTFCLKINPDLKLNHYIKKKIFDEKFACFANNEKLYVQRIHNAQ